MSRADEIMAKLGKAKVSYNQCCGAATFLGRGPGADSGSWQKKAVQAAPAQYTKICQV